MRTTEQTMELDCGKPMVTFTQRLITPVASLLRAFRNRSEINHLNDLNDNQLRDIGLTRADLAAAMLTSTFFEDPSDQLTHSAKKRWRLTLVRSYEE